VVDKDVDGFKFRARGRTRTFRPETENGPTPRLFLAWSTLNHVTGIHISPAFLIVAATFGFHGAYTVNDSANRRIMKLGPDELMGGIGYFLQIYASPERSRSGGRFRLRGAPERLQTGQHHHPSISLFQQIQTPCWLRGCRLRSQVSLGNHRISRQKFDHSSWTESWKQSRAKSK
jgi:hypothetical protein